MWYLCRWCYSILMKEQVEVVVEEQVVVVVVQLVLVQVVLQHPGGGALVTNPTSRLATTRHCTTNPES